MIQSPHGRKWTQLRLPKRIQHILLFSQDVQTPRSNRSVDSGLPHDDITPRSDSLSTASSSNSPPHGGEHHHHHQQHHLQQQQQQLSQREIQQQHRKSTSMDDINITPNPVNGGGVPAAGMPNQMQQFSKTGSLQRGAHPPPSSSSSNDPIYGSLVNIFVFKILSKRFSNMYYLLRTTGPTAMAPW